ETTYPEWQHWLSDIQPASSEQNIAMQLANATQPLLIIGALANHLPQAATIRSLAQLISELCQGQLLILPEANSRGLTFAGVVPTPGKLTASELLEQQRRAYVLFDVEPEYDCADPASA